MTTTQNTEPGLLRAEEIEKIREFPGISRTEVAALLGHSKAQSLIIDRLDQNLNAALLANADLAEANFRMRAALEAIIRLSKFDTCGDCDPCIGGRPDQCAVNPSEIAKMAREALNPKEQNAQTP